MSTPFPLIKDFKPQVEVEQPKAQPKPERPRKAITSVSASVTAIRRGKALSSSLVWWTAEVAFFGDRAPKVIQVLAAPDESPPAEWFLAAAVNDAIRAYA